MKTAKGTTYYFTKDVLKKLNITRNRLRGLTTAIEKQGRRFQRNKNNQRLFFEEDVQLLSALQNETRQGALLEEAADKLCGKKNKIAALPINMSATPSDEVPILPAQRLAAQTIALTEEQFRLVVEQVAVSAAEKTAEHVIKKYDHEIEQMIERRDRELMNRLREASERGSKKKWLFRVLGAAR